jgi:hypothetical protein
MVFLSGSVREQLSGNKYVVLGFLVALVAWYLFTDRKISDRFVLYAAAFFLLLFSLHLYTSGGVTMSAAIGWLMKLVMAYLVVKAVGAGFINIYIKLIVFLAIVSLFGYVSDQLYLLEGLVRRLPPVGTKGYEGIFYLYRFPWHIDRNNSIFFEPGAYQGFLNAALFLLLFTETGFKNRTKWIFVTILAVTLVTTFSTAGFVILGFAFPIFLYRSRIATFSGKIMIVAAIFAVIAVFAGQFYSSFFIKVSTYLGVYEREAGVRNVQISGAANRAADYKADLKIFREHIFGIGYEQYAREFSSKRGDIEIQTGSNGVTSTLAIFGLPFTLFLFGSYYWALKRLLGDFLLASLAFGMLVLFLWSEAWYVGAPIIYAIVAGAFVLERRSAPRAAAELAN